MSKISQAIKLVKPRWYVVIPGILALVGGGIILPGALLFAQTQLITLCMLTGCTTVMCTTMMSSAVLVLEAAAPFLGSMSLALSLFSIFPIFAVISIIFYLI